MRNKVLQELNHELRNNNLENRFLYLVTEKLTHEYSEENVAKTIIYLCEMLQSQEQTLIDIATTNTNSFQVKVEK